MRYIPAPEFGDRQAGAPCAAEGKAAAHRMAAIEAQRTEERLFIAEQARKSMEAASLACGEGEGEDVRRKGDETERSLGIRERPRPTAPRTSRLTPYVASIS